MNSSENIVEFVAQPFTSKVLTLIFENGQLSSRSIKPLVRFIRHYNQLIAQMGLVVSCPGHTIRLRCALIQPEREMRKRTVHNDEHLKVYFSQPIINLI